MSHFRFGFIPHARVFAFRTKKNKNPIAFEVWRFLTQKIWPWKLRERRRVLFLSIEPNRRFWFFSPLHFCIQLYCSMWIAHLAYLHLLNPNCALQTCTLFWCHLRVMYSYMQRARFDRGSMYIPFLSSWLQSPTRFWRANLVKTKRSQSRDYVSFKIRKLEVNLLTRLLSIFIHEPTSMTAHGLWWTRLTFDSGLSHFHRFARTCSIISQVDPTFSSLYLIRVSLSSINQKTHD